MDVATLMSRSILTNHLDYCRFQESFDDFHLWSILSVIGAATNRRIYFDQYYHKVYTNMYICLISNSAISRKSSAMNMAMKLYESALVEDAYDIEGSQLVRGKITPADMIKALSESAKKPDGLSNMFIQADELSVFLSDDAKAAGIVEIMTTLYTCPGATVFRTKTQGRFLVKNAFMNILAATVPDYIVKSVSGVRDEGFVGRFCFVYREGRQRAIPRTKQIIGDMTDLTILKDVIIEQLRALSHLSGEMTMTEKAGQTFDRWYGDNADYVDGEMLSSTDTPDTPKPTNTDILPTSALASGFIGRKGDHVLKLAMLLTIAENPGIETLQPITEGSILAAIQMANNAEKNLVKIFDSKPEDRTIEKLPLVEAAFEKKHRLSKTSLNSLFYRRMSKLSMDQIMTALESAHIIVYSQTGKTSYWYWVPPRLRSIDSDTTLARMVLDEYSEGTLYRKDN